MVEAVELTFAQSKAAVDTEAQFEPEANAVAEATAHTQAEEEATAAAAASSASFQAARVALLAFDGAYERVSTSCS